MLFQGLLVEQSQIKNFIENVICGTDVIMGNEQGVPVEEKILLSKAILKLLREITDEQDGRIDYQSRAFQPQSFAFFIIKVCYSCLGILREVNVESGYQLLINQANHIMKRSMRICLQIGKSELVKRCNFEQTPALKDSFGEMLKKIMHGMFVLIKADNAHLCQLNYKSQKLYYEFLQFMVSRNFGTILGLC